MEKLTDVLKKTGKASVRELAAILKIDFRDALALLKDHEQEGRTECVNGYWQLSKAKTPPEEASLKKSSVPVPATIPPEDKLAGISSEELLKLLAEKGAMTADELAQAAGVTARKVASTLAMPTSKGRVLRQQLGGKFKYCLRDQNAVVSARDGVTDSAPAPAPAPTPTRAEIAGEGLSLAPLKVVWSAPEDVQEFPTLTWVRQRRRELRNESRWLDQIENIVRQIGRKKAAVAYFRERV